MALTLGTPARNAACDAVVDLPDGGSPGKLKIKESTTELAVFTLSNPAFEAAGTASPGSARAIGGDDTNPVTSGNPLTTNAVAAGTADNYDVTDSADTVIWSGVVTGTGGGGDLELDNTSIANGQEVRITAWTHAQPA